MTAHSDSASQILFRVFELFVNLTIARQTAAVPASASSNELTINIKKVPLLYSQICTSRDSSCSTNRSVESDQSSMTLLSSW